MGKLVDGPIGDELRKIEHSIEKDEIVWNDDIEQQMLAYIRDKRVRCKLAKTSIDMISRWFD